MFKKTNLLNTSEEKMFCSGKDSAFHGVILRKLVKMSNPIFFINNKH